MIWLMADSSSLNMMTKRSWLSIIKDDAIAVTARSEGDSEAGTCGGSDRPRTRHVPILELLRTEV